MTINKTHIVNWRELHFGKDYYELCKVHVLTPSPDETIYVREFSDGRTTRLEVVSEEKFYLQVTNKIG